MTGSVTPVLLAAGTSSRMGHANKLLLDLHGQPLVVRAAELLVDLDYGSPIVVIGHESEQMREALSHCPVRIVENADYLSGQVSSVRAGLRAVAPDQTTLLCLSDQPLLTKRDLTDLMAIHVASAEGRITIPVRPLPNADGQERGNPLIIPAAIRRIILSEDLRVGCRALTRERPELVHFAPVKSDGYFRDIDTPDDYRTLSSAEFGDPGKDPTHDHAHAQLVPGLVA